MSDPNDAWWQASDLRARLARAMTEGERRLVFDAILHYGSAAMGYGMAAVPNIEREYRESEEPLQAIFDPNWQAKGRP